MKDTYELECYNFCVKLDPVKASVYKKKNKNSSISVLS